MALTCATVSVVMARLHAINQTITGVTAYRYWQQNFDSAKLPMIIPIPGRATYNRDKGREAITISRAYTLALYVRYFESGRPTESAQNDTEALIDTIYETYYMRPRLSIEAAPTGAPLDNTLSGAVITEDTGIIQEGNNIASVRFTLQVDTFQLIQELN